MRSFLGAESEEFEFSELGLKGRRRWTDAGDVIDAVAPKRSTVVDDEEDQVAVTYSG